MIMIRDAFVPLGAPTGVTADGQSVFDPFLALTRRLKDAHSDSVAESFLTILLPCPRAMLSTNLHLYALHFALEQTDTAY
jgi:hypothetical protein